MKIYKKCSCCGRMLFLMLGSDFGNEVELGSSFGAEDNLPHNDTNHEEDWHCLANFLTGLSSSHGEVYLSLKDKEKNKLPESYKETILSFTEQGYKPTEPPRPEMNTPKTLKDWQDSKKISYQDYQLLSTPWTESRDLFVYEVVLDADTLYSWKEITDYLKRAKLAKKKKDGEKLKAEEINKRMNDGKDWSQINPGFKQEGEWTYKRNWVRVGFTYESCKEWIDIGMKPDNEDFMFCAWLRDKRRLTAEEVLNYGDIKELKKQWEREEFEYFD